MGGCMILPWKAFLLYGLNNGPFARFPKFRESIGGRDSKNRKVPESADSRSTRDKALAHRLVYFCCLCSLMLYNS